MTERRSLADVPHRPSHKGSMAELIRAHDWASTPLGPMQDWPQSLNIVVDLMLASGHAMQLAWGPEQRILYNDAFAALLGPRHPSALGLPLREASQDRWEEIEPLVERVLAGEGVQLIDIRLAVTQHGSADGSWWNLSCSPVRDETGAIAGLLAIAAEVTARRRAEAQQSMLLAELQHRVRNIMAMIRSIARRTGESATTVEDYVQHLEGRISAMARTQALLTREVQATLDLENLIRDELEMQSARQDQFDVTGPDVTLPPKAAEVLGLALHELATNATKYGALSQKGGHVDVRWALLEGERLPQLSLIWSESGVSVQGEPSRQGFGTELITRRVPYELQGTGTMEFRPGGLVATIEFPLSDQPGMLQTG